MPLFSQQNSFNLTHTEHTAKSLQSCPTLRDPIDGSPPGFPVPGILQARTLEWVAISFSNAWKWKVKVKSLSRVQLLVIPWTAAYQAPPPMGFSRQEYWSGMPLPPLLYYSSYLFYTITYICQCYFTNLSHPLLPPLCLKIHSLCLHSFHANRFNSTIFLDSIYML